MGSTKRIAATLLLCAGCALAQSGNQPSSGSDRTGTATDRTATANDSTFPAGTQSRDHSNWGWIGILGLGGLAGLRGRKDIADTQRTRSRSTTDMGRAA